MLQSSTTVMSEGGISDEDAGRKFPKFRPFDKYVHIYRVSRGECARLQENVPYVKVHRYNPKHLYPKLNGYGDNGERSL